jgi:hypothetical protein
VNKYNIFADYLYFEIKNRRQGPKTATLVPEVYFYYFHCEGERENKPLEPGYKTAGGYFEP